MHKLLEFSINKLKHDIWIMVLNLHLEEGITTVSDILAC